jgi:hypothetical protein
MYAHNWFVDVCSIVFVCTFLCNNLKLLDSGLRGAERVGDTLQTIEGVVCGFKLCEKELVT